MLAGAYISGLNLVLAGERRGSGGNGWIDGPLNEAGKQQALEKLG